jgi:ubiquinone/menaquinone biosynthesis C-methylase UbiE/uncharacterized protein YbaR (Trm112 family)
MDVLVCPACHSKLRLHILSEQRKDGVLRCPRKHAYPIINGLPKILVGGLESDYAQFLSRYREELASENMVFYSEANGRAESRQDQDTFREKWTSKDTMGVSSSSPYKAFMRKWMLEKYGWKNEAGFAEGLRGRQLILDAGAGLGREVINLATAAPEATVVGLEFSDCAANALRNVSPLQNACIVQGDIMRMPFAEDSFDYILSEGVLHHTPKTQEAFKKCCVVLKKGGEIAFYIYRKKGPIREFADDFLRKVIQDMSVEEKWRMAERITSLGKSLSEAHVAVEISEGIPELGIKKGEIDVQRFIYYSFLKCFWNQELPFEENVIINFDWYVPRHAQRHTEEEIRGWCKENAIKIVWFHEEESGYSVRGIKT